jgi:ATP-dependent helicase STH1/SNF2
MDTRITHLLRQNEAYLNFLAQAVVTQQNEGGTMHETRFRARRGPSE